MTGSATISTVQGDCLTAQLPDEAHLVYADPPYGAGVVREGKAGGYDDTLTGPDYIDWVVDRLIRCAGIVRNGWVVLHHDPLTGMDVQARLSEVFRAPVGTVAWQDAWVSGFRSRASSFWPKVHDLLVFWRIGDAPFTVTGETAPDDYKRRGGGGTKWRPHSDVWVGPWSPGHLSFSKEKVGWPDQKPVALLKRIITATTRPGDLVLDPFMGSGTTLVAAQALGRNAYGIDQSASAVAVARDRLASDSGSQGADE